MANYILKELPGEMTEGKTVIYPKMKRFSMFGYEIERCLKRPQAADGRRQFWHRHYGGPHA